MSDKVTNELIYETLKRMQETLASHTQYHLETKERLGFLEQQYASISRRVDRIDERLERVERRLDLVES
jgi:predicted  nucleic acid-binding Zn-ribbon protein